MRRLPSCLAALCLLVSASPASAQTFSVTGSPTSIDVGTRQIGEIQQLLSGFGSAGPFIFTVTDPSKLPPGTSLRTDLPPWAPPGTTAGIIGVATTPGVYHIPLQVTDGALTNTHTLTMHITTLAIVDMYQLPDAFAGQPYEHQFTAANASGATVWSVPSWHPLPAGFTLSSTGLLSAASVAAGTYNIEVGVTDTRGETVYRGFSLGSFDLRITTDGLLPIATHNQPYSALVVATGGTAPRTFSTNSLPPGLVLDPITGAITGTVTCCSGRWQFSLSVTDAANVAVVKTMSIPIVSSPPALPSVTPSGTRLDDCTVGVPCGRALASYYGGVPPFSWSASGLAPGMTLRSGSGVTTWWIAPGDAEIWGAATLAGNYNPQITITDSTGASATNIFPFRISELLQTDYLAQGNIHQPYTSRLRVIGGTGSYAVTMTAGRLPVGMTFNPATMTVSGSPMESGSFNAEFVFTDTGGRQLRNTNYFFIAGDPIAPTTIQIHSSDLGIVRPGQFYSTTLNACCLPVIEWQVETGSTLPAGLSLSAAGVLSGTPNTEGTYAFSVRAYDPTNTSNAAVRQLTLKVSPFSIQVVAPAFPYTGNAGTAFTMTFASTGGTEPVTYAVAPYNYPPAGLAISGNSLTGTPLFSGQFNFQIIGTDSAGRSSWVYVSVSIYAAGKFPPLNLTTWPILGPYQVGQVTQPLFATGGTGVYHFSLAPGAPEIPGVRVQDGQPLPTFFGSATAGLLGVVETPGVYQTTVRVTDSAGAFFDKDFTLTVTSLSILSQFSGPKAAVGTPYAFTVIPYGGSGNYGWSATNLPPGLDINTFTGEIAGTPTAAGSYFANLTLTDLSSAGPDRIFSGLSITVDAFNIVTPSVLVATAGVPFSHTFSAPLCPACTWSVSSTPFGLSFDAGTRTLSGTPTFSTSFSFAVVANGGTPATTVQKLLALFVNASPIQPLSIPSVNVGPTTVGTGSTFFSPFATGGSAPYSWAVVGGNLPPGTMLAGDADGANLSPGRTYLAGRTLQAGSYTFTLQVTDALGNTATRAFTWDVSALASLYQSLPLAVSTLRYGQPYSQPLLVIGGSSRYTWSATGLPLGLSLDPATGVISGTPLNTGFYNVPLTVSDDLGNTLSTFVFLNIVSSSTTTVSFQASPNLGTVSIGTSPSFSLGPTGGTAPYTVTLPPGSVLPPGFALLTGDALTFGTPGVTVALSGTAIQPGTYTFTVNLQDSAVPPNVGGRTFTLVVSPISLLTSPGLRDGAVGTPYAQSLAAVSAGDAVSWSAAAGSALPPGLTLAADGLLSGTPTAAGTYFFQVTATSGAASSTFFFSLKISPIGIDGPSILPSASVGTPYSYTFTSSGGGSPVWSAFGLPLGLTMSTGGVISGTPTSGGFLSNVTITLSDGTNSMTRRFVLAVRAAIAQPLNAPPLSLAPLSDLTVGQVANISISPSGGVGPYTVALAPGSVLPPDLALLEGTQAQPVAFPGSVVLAGIIKTAGTFTFTLVFTDSEGRSTERTYTLHTTPIAFPSTVVRPITAGVPYSQQLTATGGTGPYTFSATPSLPNQDALPPGISLSSSGLLSGTTTSTGSYTLSLRIVDAAGASYTRLVFLSVSTTTNLRINSVNPANVPAGIGTIQTLQAGASAPSVPVFSWSLTAGMLPPGLVIQSNPSNPAQTTLSGVPSVPGTYVYTLRATDTTTGLGFAERVFTFRVSPMQLVQPPQSLLNFADLPSATRGVPYSTRFRAAGGQPPYSFTLAASTPVPAGLTLAFDGTLAGTPTQSGLYPLAVVVTDVNGVSYFAPAATLQVAPPGVPPALLAIFSPSGAFVTSAVTDASGNYTAPGSSGVTTMGMASVGVLFRFPLNVNRGGVAPFSWSVAPGSSLPPGMAIYAGSNGVPDFLGGVPTTAGPYSFSLVVTDAAGQSLTQPLSLTVSNLSVTPDRLPPGMVGAPLAVTFTPAGGSGPYAMTASPQWDMPPGLSLVGNTISGTPTIAGSFLIGLNVSDGTGQTLFRVLPITIDNALGEAPAVSLSPAAIDLTYIQSSPDPGPVLVNVSSTSGAIPYALAAEGIGGTTVGAPPGPTPSATAVDFHLSSRAVGTYTGLLAVHSTSAANLVTSVPIVVRVVPPPPCTYTFTPSSGSKAAAGGFGSFALNTGSTCAWTVSSPNSWITVNPGGIKSGTGAKTIHYSAAANTGVSERTGTILAGGAIYTLTQFGSGCGFAISPAGLSAPAAGGTATVTVTASNGACGWTASDLGASPTSGTGNGSVTLVIPANSAPSARTLTATIAGQTFSVSQEAANCSVTLGAPGADFTDAGGAGSVAIGTEPACGYATTSAPSWVTLDAGASGTGPGTLLYTVAANSATSPRTGAVIVGGKTFTISQAAAACSVTLDTSALSAPLAAAGGTAAVGVTTNGSACGWTAVSGAPWISVVPPASNGNGVALLTLASNLSSSVGRSGTVTVGGQSVTVTQSGTACTFALQSSAGSAAAGGGTGAVGVIAPAGCGWLASSSDPSWLQPGGSSGSGTSELDFVVQPNPDPSARTGVLTVAGLAYTITQAPATCSYTLPISSIAVASGGVSGASFTLSSAAPACSPAPVSYSGWLTIDGTSFAAGTGTVTYSAAPNPLGLTRRGFIQVGAQTFTVTQLGAACGYSLAEYGRLFSRAGGSGKVEGSPSALGCAPDHGTDQPSFVTLGALSGPTLNIFTLPYSVSPFTTSLTVATRFAKITFGGQLFLIKQVSW